MRRLQLLFLCCLSGCASLGPLNPMRSVERKLLYHPTPVTASPTGNDFQSVSIAVDGSSNVHGLFLKHPSARAVLLYCHGNAGNIADRLPRLRELRAKHQLTVLGFDYRGYGASDGDPTEQGLYADARAARRWLAAKSEVSENDVVLFGRSLGGAVAVELASDGARGLILESTFTSIPDVGKSHAKFVPVSLLVSQKFDSINKIDRYNGPLLQAHGNTDKLVPYELGRKLHAAANAPKQFLEMNGGHNDARHEDYDHLFGDFIDSLP